MKCHPPGQCRRADAINVDHVAVLASHRKTRRRRLRFRPSSASVTSNIAACWRRPATRQDRPRGYAPRGTSLGFVAMSGLAVAVPCDVLQSAAPFTPGGFERLIDWLPFFLPLGFIPLVLIILFARTRRYWVVCAFFIWAA
jgi:hypothetical protein